MLRINNLRKWVNPRTIYNNRNQHRLLRSENSINKINKLNTRIDELNNKIEDSNYIFNKTQQNNNYGLFIFALFTGINISYSVYSQSEMNRKIDQRITRLGGKSLYEPPK